MTALITIPDRWCSLRQCPVYGSQNKGQFQYIAALRVGSAYFLPGGGSLPGETPEATLRREILEECGRAVNVGQALGEAIEYIHAKSDGVYYEITSTFFTAAFLDGQEEPLEKDHELVWLTVAEAAERLQRLGQAWAVRQSGRRA
jgi:8-oxo-dGTP diphosphatase